MKFWLPFAVLLFLSVLIFADDHPTNDQTKEAPIRHKSRNSEGSISNLARSRKRRQLLDGRPPLQLMRGLRGLMNGFDVVLKSTRNADVLKCIPRFVCEMTAPITDGGAGSSDDAEASTTDAEGEAADEGEKDEATKEVDEEGHAEKDEAGSHRAADPDLVRQVMQTMFQMPFAFPSPFMPPPNPFLFSPFLNTVATPAAETTENTTTAPETTTEKEESPSDDDPLENEIPRPVRHLSPSQYYRPVRQVVRPHNIYSSNRSIRPVSHIQRPVSHIQRPVCHIQRPVSKVHRPNSQTQVFLPPSEGIKSRIEHIGFSPRSHIFHGSQSAAKNAWPVVSTPNRRFQGAVPIKRNDQSVRKESSTLHPRPNPREWKAANSTTFFDGRKMRTIRRYVRVQENESWFKKLFRGRRRRSISGPETTIEEIKSRVRRGIKDFIDNAGVTAREIMGALERMEDEEGGSGGLGTTSSFYPGIRAGLLGYMGDPATCEEEFKDCPTSTEEVIKTYTDIRTYYPNGFTFRDRIPRPFRWLIP